MKNKKNITLNPLLPMSNTMFAMLISKYSKTLEKCCKCPHFNGECGEFAEQGKCIAMDDSINRVLVFSDGEIEFATTRDKISKLLEIQHQSQYDGWIPETVDDVIDSYLNGEFKGTNPFATSLYENLINNVIGGIIYKIDLEE